MKKRITNPLEEKIAAELRRAGIAYGADGTSSTKNLDFHITESDVYIEVKAFHSDRIAEQMSRAENVIAIQGTKAVEWFAWVLCHLPDRVTDNKY